MVNAYKLGMVGERLKQRCGKNPSCFKEMIQKESTVFPYVFPKDSGLIKEMDLAFPECSRTACGHGSNSNFFSCAEKNTAFKKLRKAAFLDPSNRELWRIIACVYASSGFRANSLGALSQYVALSEKYTALLDRDYYQVNKYPLEKYKKSMKSNFCRKDSDCVLVPSCGYDDEGDFYGFLSMNKLTAEIYYILDNPSECKEQEYPDEYEGNTCMNKCRCDKKETVFELDFVVAPEDYSSSEKMDPEESYEKKVANKYWSQCFASIKEAINIPIEKLQIQRQMY